MKIKEFLDRSQVQTVTGLAPQILGEGTGPEKEVLGRLGQDRAAAGLVQRYRCLAEGAPGIQKEARSVGRGLGGGS